VTKEKTIKMLKHFWCFVFGHNYQYTKSRITGHDLPNFVCKRCDKGVDDYDDTAELM